MAATRLVARLVPWGIVGIVLSVSATGCGDPGAASLSIGLGRTDSGQLVLLGTTCSGNMKSIELGPGGDWTKDANTTIKPVEPTSGEYSVPLPDPRPGYISSPEMTSEPAAPFFVRVQDTDGETDQSFTELPSPGKVIYRTSGENSNRTHPFDDFPGPAVCG